MGTKFSKSFKMQAVKKALTRGEEISMKDIANELSVGYSTLQKWVVQTRNNELESCNEPSPKEHIMTHEKRPEDWNIKQRLAIIIKCGALDDNGAAQLCREQGIYLHHVNKWKKDIIDNSAKKSNVTPETAKMKRQIKLLQKELNRKEKALAETAALLVLKKKVNQLWDIDGEL